MRVQVAKPGSKETVARAQAQQPQPAVKKPQPRGMVAELLNLQRTHGNRFVGQLLNGGGIQRKCACGSSCPRCQKFPLMQTQLKINEPGDHYEQEADRIADRVMRMPTPSVQRQMEPEEDEETGMVQREAIHAGAQAHKNTSPTPLDSERSSSEVPPIVHEVLRSPVQLLDPATRAFMEPRFSQDFSQVRVHSGAAAEQSARDVNARAYTVRQNIVFGPGSFAPGTHEGRRLIAHELTHVVQQNGATASRMSLEQGELHVKKSPSASIQPVPIHLSCRPTLHRFPTHRGGGATAANMTPKEKDMEGSKRGLSTFEDPLRAPIRIEKAQIIETDNLPTTLEAVRNGTGPNDTHVSIRPPNDPDNAKLLAWAEAGPESTLSQQVLRAVIGTWKRPKEKKE